MAYAGDIKDNKGKSFSLLIFQDAFYESVLKPAGIYLLKVKNGNSRTNLCKVSNKDIKKLSLTSF